MLWLAVVSNSQTGKKFVLLQVENTKMVQVSPGPVVAQAEQLWGTGDMWDRTSDKRWRKSPFHPFHHLGFFILSSVHSFHCSSSFNVPFTSWRSCCEASLLLSFNPSSSVLPPAQWDAGWRGGVSGIHQGHAQHHTAVSAALPGWLPAHQLVQVLLLYSRLRGGPHQEEGIDRWEQDGLVAVI